MDQQTRTLLKAEIEVYLAKFPDASVNQQGQETVQKND